MSNRASPPLQCSSPSDSGIRPNNAVSRGQMVVSKAAAIVLAVAENRAFVVGYQTRTGTMPASTPDHPGGDVSQVGSGGADGAGTIVNPGARRLPALHQLSE